MIGFIIGIEGKNINTIRDESKARIEVFPQTNSKMRQIEIAGNPNSISKAAEKIFSIEEKYCNFNKRPTSISRSPPTGDSKRKEHHRSRSREYRSSFDDDERYEKERRNRHTLKLREKDNISGRDPDREREQERNIELMRDRERDRNNEREKEKGEIEMDLMPSSIINSRHNSIQNNNNSNTINNQNEIVNDLENKSPIMDEIKQNNPSNNMQNNIITTKNSINLIYSINDIDKVKESMKNIWNSMENEHNCQIEEKEMIIDNEKKSLITFTGTPEENSTAIFHLQQFILDSFKKVKLV